MRPVQLEFPWVHMRAYGGDGLTLPGPMQPWVQQFDLNVIFSEAYYKYGKIDNYTVRVGVIVDNSTKMRIMRRDFTDPGGPGCRVATIRPCGEIGVTFHYMDLRWEIHFFCLSNQISLRGRKFEVILTDREVQEHDWLPPLLST